MRSSYVEIADQIARRVASGDLAIGQQLPPQRMFALQHGIAASTVSRVYEELKRRGLVVGEIGRGTFVKSRFELPDAQLMAPTSANVDLELVFPFDGIDLMSKLTKSFVSVSKTVDFSDFFRPFGPAGTAAARATTARFLSTPNWQVNPDNILFCGNGKQAIAATINALMAPGERLGVERLTYHFLKTIARNAGIGLVPIEVDNDGLVPASVEQAHANFGLSAMYIQPTLQNPMAITMPAKRRSELASVLSTTGILAIEDGVFSFLADETPVASLIPEQVIFVDSMSKRIAPGLSLGMLIIPHHLKNRVSRAIVSGAWAPFGVALSMSVSWMDDGTSANIVTAKRQQARERNKIAREVLSPLMLLGDERAYHLWLSLPKPWRGDEFAAAAREIGIAVIPGSTFAVTEGHAPAAVRIALTTPDTSILRHALAALRALAQGEIHAS